jgi:hypothetical protein
MPFVPSNHGEIRTVRCALAAFRLIQQLPQEKAIPILIRYLGYKRPITAEFQAPRPYPLYPAVETLYSIGVAAEPALIEFVAQNEDETSIEHHNALYALALMRHADVVPTIKLLRERSLSLAGSPAANHLDFAARYLLKTYCPGKVRQRCEDRLRQSD